MTSRIVFGLITLFWVIMNVLLWRSEIVGSAAGGSPVSLAVVLEKILTSPDPSTLEIRCQGQAAGFLHWYPDPGEELQTALSEDYVPQGMVSTERGLQVRLEGSVSPPALETHLRLDLELTLDAQRAWKTVSFRGGNRQAQVTVNIDQPEQRLDWRVQTGDYTLEHQVDLRETLDPQKLLGPVGKTLAPFLSTLPGDLTLADNLEWDARLDWMPFGSSRIRIYRVKIRWQDRYEATLLVNRAGELLRVDLPGGWRLYNEGLAAF